MASVHVPLTLHYCIVGLALHRSCQVLILSPTRELAQQTEKVILAIGDFMNVQAHACIGGKSLGECLGTLGSSHCPV